MRRLAVKNHALNGTLLLLGVLSAAVGLESFLLPNGFLDGGVTGISMFLAELTGWDLAFFLVIVNIPFLFIGGRHFGKKQALVGSVTIALLAGALFLLPLPAATSDKLLAATFGGAFLGVGMGFALHGGGVLDGTDLLALFLSRKTGSSVGTIVLIFNAVLFLTVAGTFGLERAMYSTLTYLVASKSVNLVLHGIEEYAGVTVISKENTAIRQTLLRDLGIGLTSYLGKTGFSETEQEILYCVVSRFDLPKVRDTVRHIDDKAFIVTHPVTESTGGLIRTRTRRFSR